MNLFTESLANYIKNQWDDALKTTEGTREARFIIESLDPKNTYDLFSTLEEHRLRCLQHQKLECHFRIAHNLWKEWLRHFSLQHLDANAITQYHSTIDEQLGPWIDKEDRLTWYRNRTRPSDMDGLIVILVGLNHASDQGGLADFHQVDETRIWHTLQHSYVPWIERLSDQLGLSATESEVERFDGLIHQLFQIRPRRLAKLAEFLEKEVIAGDTFYNLNEVIKTFHEKLPFWGIPPLIIEPVTAKKSNEWIKEAGIFISHQRFKTPSEQKKAWTKLERSFAEQNLETPHTISPTPLYTDPTAFQETLRAFIFDADADARERLLQTDLRSVLEALKRKPKKEDSPPTKDKVQRLSGFSLDVLLQAIWKTLGDFKSQYKGHSLTDTLQHIKVVIKRFNHDLRADEDAGIGGEEQAQELLQGCLGGLPDWFERHIDCHLPVDSDQAQQRREYWQYPVPITLHLDEVTFGTSRARPHLLFEVLIEATDGRQPCKRTFQWAFGPTQAERVRHAYIKTILEAWQETNEPATLLPAFTLPTTEMTAIYFAADADEAHYLINQALVGIRLHDLLAGLPVQAMDPQLWQLTRQLIHAYREWLQCCVDQGYYHAIDSHRYLSLTNSYINLANEVLNPGLMGSAELLRRFYKAFLLVDEQTHPNDDYLRAAIVWGVSLPVIELTQARTHFLCNDFPEVVAKLALGHNGDAAFAQLLNLAEIHRPLAGLIIDPQRTLSAASKSFGLLHYLGDRPSIEKSLAVQTLLRDDDGDDDETVSELTRPSKNSDIVEQVLNDYLSLHAFAEDGLRILAVHVEDLATSLSGVDRFLQRYLKRTSSDWPPFHCQVMVYSTASAPLTMESRLAAWRDAMNETYREKGRALVLAVGHRFAPDQTRILEWLKQERRLYDIAFLFHFLMGGITGETERALPFLFDYNSNNISLFPISEYPRPTQQGDAFRRQSLLSNRRLRMQTRHADLSARLRHPQTSSAENLIFGLVDYQPWLPVVEALHGKAQWVACIDPFVDKRLLGGHAGNDRRKIVGFTSGLGAYGELNLSISTEQDTLTQLTALVQNHLIGLLPFQDSDSFEAMAVQVVAEAEEVIGLSSLRAVVGQGERIREVVGFAAIRRALASPPAAMSQLLPIDALLHWLAGSEITARPDLLQLSLVLRENDLPLIHAVVIECKFAQHNPAHLLKASDQVQQGLSHFIRLFAPNRSDLRQTHFDRRYWWAQLHRALTSRSVVALSDQDWRRLDRALEQLAEGYYEIAWQGAIFTFWTNEPGATPVITAIPLSAGVIESPMQTPDSFAIQHIALGYVGVTALFTGCPPPVSLTLDGPALRVRAEMRDADPEPNIPETPHEPSAPDPSNIPNAPSESNVSDDPPESPESPESPEPHETNVPGLSPATLTPPRIAQETNAESPPRLSAPFITVPERILIGTRTNGEPVYWHYGHSQLANRHLLIFGASGSGKTYGVQCVLAEMAHQGLRSIIIDYTDGFLPNQVEQHFTEVVKPKNHFVITDQLPLNPFRRQRQLIDPSMPAVEESSFYVASRIASIFTSVFNTMGDQQSSTLIRVLETGIEDDPRFSLDGLLVRLRDDGQYGESLASKLEPLIRSQPFRAESDSAWDNMLSSPEQWVHILQLKGLARDIQRLVTEFVLWDLYDYASNTGSKNRPIPVVLDEIQNLDHRGDAPIDKMLREGRKFGLSLILATQTTSQFSQEARDRLFQAGHQLFFKPATSEIDRFAQLLSQSTGVVKSEWGERLAKLEKGQCWSLGSVLTSSGGLQEKPVLVSVTSLENRNLGG